MLKLKFSTFNLNSLIKTKIKFKMIKIFQNTYKFQKIKKIHLKILANKKKEDKV